MQLDTLSGVSVGGRGHVTKCPIPCYKKAEMGKRKTYTITEAAEKLGISRQAVHEAIRKKRLKTETVKVTQEIHLIPADALANYSVSRSHKTRGKKN